MFKYIKKHVINSSANRSNTPNKQKKISINEDNINSLIELLEQCIQIRSNELYITTNTTTSNSSNNSNLNNEESKDFILTTSEEIQNIIQEYLKIISNPKSKQALTIKDNSLIMSSNASILWSLINYLLRDYMEPIIPSIEYYRTLTEIINITNPSNEIEKEKKLFEFSSNLSLSHQKILGGLFSSVEILSSFQLIDMNMLVDTLFHSLFGEDWKYHDQVKDTIILDNNNISVNNTNNAKEEAFILLASEHRVHFPYCYTFARKLGQSIVPSYETNEWRMFVYQDQSKVDRFLHINNKNKNKNHTLGLVVNTDIPDVSVTIEERENNNYNTITTKQQQYNQQYHPNISNASPTTTSGGNASTMKSTSMNSKAYRSTYEEELPLNDINNTMSIDGNLYI